LAFLSAGFGMSCWAPLVPFAKARLGVGDGALGLLLLSLGIGSVVAMPITGAISARFGCKPMILAGGMGLVVLLPLLAAANTAIVLAACLFAFGASVGTIDVAMNVHAVEVERTANEPLMSGFHAQYSIGGIAGSGAMTALLSAHFAPLGSALSASALILIALLIAQPNFLRTQAHAGTSLFVRPRGIVLLLAALVALIFLAEGAILDWSALLLTESQLASAARGGVGYLLFSVAMTIGRLTGDRVVARLGRQNVLVWGGALAAGGFVILLCTRQPAIAMSGFLCIGLGAANIVPILFSRAGSQTVMPTGIAVAAITTSGYAGILAGPALIGWIAHSIGLHAAFWMLACFICAVPIFARAVTRTDEQRVHVAWQRKV
jgi:predicted MFS family arabinose efflux permease